VCLTSAFLGIRAAMLRTQFSLPPAASSPRTAREQLRPHISGWGDDDRRDCVLVLLSELVTNAVLHARSEITVHLDLTDDRLRVQVDDSSRTPPVRRPTRDDVPGGRGLQLLDVMSEQWGVLTSGAGKTVWFEICS
jgi:anti-sigma regulatory factor (Ser/Thr protein kinase)